MTRSVDHGMTRSVDHGMTRSVDHGMMRSVDHGMTRSHSGPPSAVRCYYCRVLQKGGSSLH